MGRFLSVDPVMDLSQPSQWGAYKYADHNPITFSDPTGPAAAPAAAASRAPAAAAPRAPAAATGGGGRTTRSGACSFVGATPVLMATGERKPIAQVRVGDQVLATDPETGEQGAREVQETFVHLDDVVGLTVDGEKITTTEDHPFWSVTAQEFVRADALQPGDTVLGADWRELVVGSVRVVRGPPVPAYNLAVHDIHTYHVGNNDILVHNDCLTGGAGGTGAAQALPTPAEAAQLIKSSRPTGSALKRDPMHRAGDWVIDDVAQNGSVFNLVGGDGVSRTLVQMPGGVNGVAGRFEWILESGNLTHQLFVRGGRINGMPIQP